MLISVFRNRFITLSFLLALLGMATLTAAQTIVSRNLNLNELDSVPATIEVSPDFLTIIEFEGLGVVEVRSGRPDQITVETGENIVTIRANQEVVNTDLIVRVAGRTAIFKLVSASDAENSRRYVVRDEEPPNRGLQGNTLPGGLAKPTDLEILPLPPGLDLEISAYRPSDEAIVIQYGLTNDTQHPFANDSQRLRIYADGISVYRELEASPVPGRPGRLSVGESEYGQIVIPNVPANTRELEFEWALVEIGPGTEYRVTRDLRVALGEKLPEPGLNAPPVASAEAPSAEAPSAEAPSAEAPLALPNSAPEAAEEGPAAANEPPEAAAESAATEDEGNEGTPTFSANLTASSDTVEPGEEITFTIDITTEVGRLEDGLFDFEVFDAEGSRVDQQFQANLSFNEGDTLTQTFSWTPEEAGNYWVRFGVFRWDWSETLYWNDGALIVTVGDGAVQVEADSEEPTSDDGEVDTAVEPTQRTPELRTVLASGDFESAEAADTWSLTTSSEAEANRELRDGEACIEVSASGAEPWDIGFGYTAFPLVEGQTYRLYFDAYADKPVNLRPAVGINEAPWTEFFGQVETLSTQPKAFSYAFEASQNGENNRLIFFLGGNENVPYRICLDNISFTISSDVQSDVATDD